MTQPYPHQQLDPQAYAHLASPVSPADRVVTVLLVLVLGYVAVFGAMVGVVLTVESDDCQSIVPCFDGPTNAGFLASGLAPVVIWVAALVVVIVRWANRRPTWPVPVVAAVVGLLVWRAGLLVAGAA